MVKRIGNDKFYVYGYSTSKVCVIAEDGTARWKIKTTMGRCIGEITLEDGYIPHAAQINNDDITAKNYGDYAFAVDKAQHALTLLKEIFTPQDAVQIFTVAVILFVNGFTYMKNAKGLYEMSYLSSCFPGVRNCLQITATSS
ncbi:hypothetical protein [uncultured Acetatifactor sp.]|uniref:hypothetical protein n=1 Tax=uncultured Acetatifactor sp. TaxID=1671927 RepID=UPI00261E87E9|nr:hypothetical protein [uncultured Acetatifactor sp.]